MKRILPFPVLAGALFASWLALTGEPSPAQIVLAAALALAVPHAAAPFLEHLPRIAAPATAVRFTLLVTWDIVLANASVARLVLGPERWLKPAFIEVPVALAHPHAVSLLASIIAMTPGTVSAALSPDRMVLLVHALDCADPAALVERIKQRYEQPLKEIFAC